MALYRTPIPHLLPRVVHTLKDVSEFSPLLMHQSLMLCTIISQIVGLIVTSLDKTCSVMPCKPLAVPHPAPAD